MKKLKPNLSTDEALPIIRKLTKAQKEALSRICIGDDSCLPPKTATSLDALGLIDYRLIWNGRRDAGIWRADVASIAVHMAWCQWCSETVPDSEFM